MTNQQNEMGFFQNIFAFIMAAYGISVIFFMFYFNWLYAKTNGFIAWLFFGEIIATFKAILWPVFVFVF